MPDGGPTACLCMWPVFSEALSDGSPVCGRSAAHQRSRLAREVSAQDVREATELSFAPTEGRSTKSIRRLHGDQAGQPISRRALCPLRVAQSVAVLRAASRTRRCRRSGPRAGSRAVRRAHQAARSRRRHATAGGQLEVADLRCGWKVETSYVEQFVDALLSTASHRHPRQPRPCRGSPFARRRWPGQPQRTSPAPTSAHPPAGSCGPTYVVSPSSGWAPKARGRQESRSPHALVAADPEHRTAGRELGISAASTTSRSPTLKHVAGPEVELLHVNRP